MLAPHSSINSQRSDAPCGQLQLSIAHERGVACMVVPPLAAASAPVIPPPAAAPAASGQLPVPDSQQLAALALQLRSSSSSPGWHARREAVAYGDDEDDGMPAVAYSGAITAAGELTATPWVTAAGRWVQQGGGDGADSVFADGADHGGGGRDASAYVATLSEDEELLAAGALVSLVCGAISLLYACIASLYSAHALLRARLLLRKDVAPVLHVWP